MAYVEASTTAPNRVRLLVGDISTSTAREYLHDGAYTFFVAQTPNIYAAGALAANSLAALFGGQGSEKQVGDLRIKRGDASYYRDLAKQLQRMSALQSAPYSGGRTISDKNSVAADTDRVAPAFERDQFANPDAINPTVGASTGS